MSNPRRQPASRPGGWLALGLALAGLLVLPGAARADTPALTVSPESGGPGTPVTVAGSGFCAKPACAAVRLTMSGRQFGADQRPDSKGAFRFTTQAPGGLTAGEHEIVATQVLDDGNEISASASFVYSPSKGEAAEREAENRDAVTNLVNPSAPAPSPRGVPLASAVAELTASESASLPPVRAGASVAAGTADRADDGFPVVLAVSIAAGAAALVAGAWWWRRRSLGGAS